VQFCEGVLLEGTLTNLMPRIETDINLDFKDVLIRPKRSILKSRSEVDITRSYVFRNAKTCWTGVVSIVVYIEHKGCLIHNKYNISQ